MSNYSIGKKLLKNLSNIPGWTTDHHLIVFESDDWGNIRMPSNKVYENLADLGIDLLSDEGSRFNKYDSLATAEDLCLLYEVLSSYKDSSGRSLVLTPVCNVANPDFDKIFKADFTEYYYEPFTETLGKYPGCENSFKLWKEGIEKRLFVPQFHGREHLNVKVWMRALRKRNKNSLLSFNNRMWGISTVQDPDIRVEFQAAFDFVDKDDINYQKEVISTGLDLFEDLFGYRATYFVPPNGPFSCKLEQTCLNHGIRYLSVSKIQDEPLGDGKMKKRLHWIGQKTGSGLTCITRNCFFEPGESGQDWIDSCLYDISTAFKWKKPAVISSHRVNYIGSLNAENRNENLKKLQLLFKSIIRTWPDTEFITTAELGKMISNG
ncbi:MAG: hypothetical protein WCE64_15090 [Bacteroidales bacterium]